MTKEQLETGTADLLAYVDNGVAVISFNRPAARNALSLEIFENFGRLLSIADERNDVGVVVITGEGGAFCAGGDIKGFAKRNSTAQDGKSGEPSNREEELNSYISGHQNSLSLAIYNLKKITIAAIDGAAAGAGLSIALACDLRVASSNAVLTTAFAKIGTSGDFGGSYYMSKLIGSSKTLEQYLLSPRLSADASLTLGLVNAVFPKDEFAQQWAEWAAQIASGPKLAQRLAKANIRRAADGATLVECLDAEARAMAQTMCSKDHQEAVVAFVEKRTPLFAPTFSATNGDPS